MASIDTTLVLTVLTAFICAGAVYGRRLARTCVAANEADWGTPWLNWLDGLNRLFCRRYHRLRADPIPLPAVGGAIVAANHVSGLDPLLLIAAAKRPLRFMIAREQYERFGLRWLFRAVGCIPVDRSGRPETALREALRALQKGEVVALFPHGGIHLDATQPPRLKGGAVRLAHKTGCPIVPVHIEGVSGRGHTLLAVPWRSRARLRVFTPMRCDGVTFEGCLEGLAWFLNNPPAAQTIEEHQTSTP